MEEVKKLYNALIGKGYTANDLGNEDVFAKKMQDEQSRRELYDYVSSRGDFKIGSYDNYEQRLRPAQVQKPQPVVDAYGMPMQPKVSTIEDAPKVPQVNMDEFTVNETYLNNVADNEGAQAPMEGVELKENLKSDLFKPQSTETPSLLDVDAQRKDYFAEAGAKAMEGIRQERQAREYQEIMKPLSGIEGSEQKKVLEERKKQIEAQLNQPDAVRNAAARTNMAKALENVDKELQVLNEQQKQWQEQYGSWTPSSARRFREQTMEQTWHDPYAVVPEEYKALATQKWGKEGSEDAYFSAWMNLSPEEREAFVKREHIKSFFNEETANRMQGIRERATTYAQNALSEPVVSVDPRHSASAMAARAVSNIGVQTTKALDKAEEIKQAYKNHELDENFFAGAYKGMKDGLTDIDNWTGLYMVGEMSNLYDIADKMEKGEALSQTEEDFLDAQAYKLAVEAALADDLGWGYSSGNVTGASVPFMLQMLASPIGGASGKAIDKGFAAVGRRAIDKFGKGILKKLLTKAPVKKIAKGLVGTVGKGIGQTILFGSDRVAAGTMERHLGNEMVAERANEEFNAGVQAKAGEDLGTALFKAGVSASMENISEFAGGAFIDDFTKMVGKKISKEFMDAMGGSVGKRMAKAAARQNANKVFRAIANNKWGQHAVNLSKSVQSGMEWDGLLNEFLEEVLNNVSNVMIGDMSMEDFTSLEKNAETLLGLAWTSGFFMANNAASRVGGYARGNIALKRTDRAARQIFTGDMQEKWDAYTQALSQADGYEEVEQLYKGLMTDISKNQDKEAAKAQMSEATAYMANYVKMMGMNAATEEADEEEQKTPAQKEMETAQGEGIAAQGTEEELDVVEEMDESYNQLAGHLGETNVEDWLFQYGETADKQLEAIRGSELDDQTKAMAEAYLTSAQRYEGLLLANQEEVDAIVEEAAKEFDANVNQELGSVIQVLTTQGKTAYVIQGNPNERENIRLRYEDGTTEPVPHVVIEKVLSQADAQTMRSDMIEGVRKSAVAEVVKRMQGVVPNATQMQMPVGHNVVVDGQAGVVAGVNADGTIQIQMQGGNAVNAAPQQVMDAQAYNTIMERKARARESARVSTPVREEAMAPVAEEATAAEAVAEEAVAAEEELTEAQKLLQEYMDESVSLEDRQAIVGNNVAQAKQAAIEAQAEVDAMTEGKPKATDYTSIAEFKQAQEQWKAQMQEKQQALDLARQQEATWSEVQKGMVQPVETAAEQTSAEAVPATPQFTEVQRAEAKIHNSKHDIKALAKEIGVSAKRIQRVIDLANQVGVKLNFASVTRTQGDKGALTNADNMASKREITLSKYQLAKGMAIEWVMGHELTHQIKADGNAANWEAYKQAIINALGQDTFDKRVKDQAKVYREAGAYQDMSANEFVETMQEEVCADAAGDMLLNPDNMDKVMGVPQSLASRIWSALKDMVTFGTPSKIKQAVDAWQMLAEGKELTGEEDGREEQEVKYSIPKEPIGRSLAADEAEILITDMKENADIAPELEFSIENWLSEFGKDGLVTTPIGKVKMGENQIAKLLNKNREKRFGLIRPTLQTPDVIIEKHAPAEGAERESKFLFIKTFVKPDGSRFIHFESVTVLKDGMDVSISSHEIGDKALRKEMQNGTILHLNSKLSSGFDKYLTKTPTERPDLAPTSDNRLVISSSLGGGVSPISHADDAAPAISLQSRNDDELSASKDTQSVSTEQTDKKEISEKSAESNVEVTNEEVASLPKNEGEQALFSISTYEQQGREILEAYVMDQVSKGRLTQEQADDIISEMEDIYNICVGLKDKYAPFGNWSEAEVIVNEQGKPVFSVIKANGDYAMNLDFSLVCKKRRTLDAVLREMIDRGIINNYELGQVDMAKINDIIRQHGFETACRLCFVDAKRFRVAQVADVFCEMYNALVDKSDAQLKKISKKEGKSVPGKIARMLLEHPENRVQLSRANFMDSKGFEDMTVNAEEIMKLYNAKKGTGGPKASYGDTQYLNDILGKQWSAESAYEVGGVRLQSFSDYVPRMVFDYIQMVADLSAKGLPVHAYTKEPTFAKQFGLTGIKINLSLVPRVEADGVAPGLDANGEYVWQEGETFPYEEAIAIQNAEGYRENCGTIAVGVSDAHIEKMLSDDNIRMVIPYHKSGLNPLVAKHNNIDQFQDYTNEQNTRDANGNKLTKAQMKSHFNFNADLHKHGNPRLAAQHYLEWCDENGYIPKFDKFREHPNYYKLLEDFTTCVTENGVDTFVPQGAVTMTFPNEESAFGSIASLIEEGLEEDAVLEGRRQADLGSIVDDIESEFAGGKKFSLSAEEQDIVDAAKADGTYMKTPNGKPTNLNEKQWAQVRTKAFKEWFGDWENDPENASKVVDENGEPMVVYHYTPNEFTEFDTEKIGSSTDVGALGRGFYFSPSDKFTLYGDKKMALFVNAKNPMLLNDSNAFEAKEPFFKADYKWDNESAQAFADDVQAKGYDAVYYENRGMDEIVAFRPTQIKSATDNVGTFDAENADIRYSMPGHSVASRIYGHPFTGAWQKFLQRAPKGVLKPGYGIIDESRLPEFADWYRMLVPEAEEYKEFVSLFLEDATATEKKHIQSVMDRVDKIVDDYRRLAEGDNSVLSLENNARFSITPDILAANERFNEELDEFKAKTHKGLLHLGKPGAILRTIGVDADEMTISPTILHQHLKEHGLTVDDIKGLALSVQSPILAYRHGLKYPNLVIVTEMDVKGGKLSVSLELDGDGHIVAISNIKSVHSKDAIKEVERLMDMGAESLRDNLKWVEKEEVSDWLLRLPYEDERTKDNPKLSSVANVLLSFQNPPIIGDESSQNVENAKSGEQKYSLPAGIPRRKKNESLMDYANRIADILYAQRNATRDWELQEPAIALARDKYEDRVSSGWYQTKEALQDSMLGLKVFMESVLGKGTYVEDVAGVENAYLGENRLSSVNFAEASEFARLVFKPMLEEVAKLAKNDKQRQMLVDYMMAKHGLERNRVMAEKDAQAEAKENQMMTLDELRAKYRNKDYAGLTALTNKQNIRAAEAEAQAMVDAYESTHDTSALWDKVKMTNTATLTKMRESGLLSQEMYDNIANMYEFYIPLRGFDEKTSDEAYAYLSHKDSAFNAPIRRAKGRKSKADDPFAQMQAMAESAIMQGNRNVLVKQKLLNFVQNHPSDLATVSEMWIINDAVNKEWTQITATISPTDTPADVARKTREFNETMEELHKLFPGRYQKAGGKNRIPYKVIAKNLSEHQVIVKRNGVDYVITINGSPRAAQAVNGMTNPDSGTGAVSKLFEYGEKVNRVLSGVYTSYNPDFLWSNFIRDTLYTNTMSYVKESPAWAFRFNRNFLKFNPVTMSRLLYKWDSGKLDMNDRTEALFYQFMKNGGETGYANIRNIEQHKSEIKEALKKANGRVSTKLAWDAVKNKLEFISRAAENGARFAAFATSMQMGRGVERAIYDAKEVSVNFNKKGSGATFMGATGQTTVGNAAAFTSGLGRSLYVFWNAAIQGSTNFGRQVKRHPVRALTVSSVMFGLGVLMSMIGGDDEGDENAFYNLPENIRRTNIMMRFGDHWLTLPLPVEYRAMYGMGQLAGEVLSGKSRMSGEELGMAILQQVSQMAPIDVMGAGGGWNAFTPSWAKPVIDAYVLEKNWAGQPLYKDWDTYAPEWTKAYDSADQNIVGFTRWLNEVSGGNDHRKGGIDLNPAKIEAVIDGYFGGISALTKNLVKTGEMVFGERDYQPRNIPLLRRVLYQGDERTAYRRANEQYRKYKEDHDELHREIRGYEGDMEMGTKDWTEELDRIYNSPEIEQYYIMDWYGKDISKLNKQFNETTNEEEKDAIRKEINLLKSEAVREIENLQNKKEKQE